MARPSVDSETIAFVELLISRGASDRSIESTAADAGLPVSRGTIQNIRHGRHTLAGAASYYVKPGETYHNRPVRCAAGHSVYVTPCRLCAAFAFSAAHRASPDYRPPNALPEPAPPPAAEDLEIRHEDARQTHARRFFERTRQQQAHISPNRFGPTGPAAPTGAAHRARASEPKADALALDLPPAARDRQREVRRGRSAG